jgi:hypothetical protein
MRRQVILAAMALSCAAGNVGGQSKLTMDGVMSAAEQRETGLRSLTAAQRAALDSWLMRYTMSVINIAQKGASGNQAGRPRSGGGVYAGVGEGHWIEEVSNGGAMVTLEDGSIWEINSIDRIDTALWLPATDITIIEANRPIGEYRYTFINKDDGEKALAKYIGAQ